jgi:hypothetical protein
MWLMVLSSLLEKIFFVLTSNTCFFKDFSTSLKELLKERPQELSDQDIYESVDPYSELFSTK